MSLARLVRTQARAARKVKTKGSTIMRNMMRKLWSDDQGALIATEYLFVSTIIVIGIVVGLTAVRDAVNAELTVLGDAILALNPSYTVSGTTGGGGSTAGSEATDIPSQLTPPTLTVPVFPIVISVPVS
jgi:Flp pilus assembly pilin Flp